MSVATPVETMTPLPPPVGQSRRRLPKSKTGCRQCKKRKVKCDEGRPSCKNCLKHGVECDFIIAATRSTTPASAPCPCSHKPSFDFSITDMELLHHFTTSTCLTLFTEPAARNLWRVNIPQMGFTTQYLLRGILSLSALHLARFRPEGREFYISHAFDHYNAAVAEALPLITNMTTENCVQLFLFSNITAFFAFAKPKNPTDFLLSSDHELPPWLYLLRGVRAVMEAQAPLIRSSPISAMFGSGRQVQKSWSSNKFEHEAFRELEANIRSRVPDDAHRLEVLLDTMDSLQRVYSIVYEGSQTDEIKVVGIFVWLYKVRPELVDLVGENDSEALCMLAFFCVLLRRLDFIWWMEGWGLHLIERIHSRLSVSYRLWLRWPIEEIGWVPPTPL